MVELTSWMPLLATSWAAAFGIAGLAGLRPTRVLPASQDAPEEDTDAAFELGRTPIAAEPVDVAHALNGAIRRLEAEPSFRFCRIRFAAMEELRVRADPRAMRRVLRDVIGVGLRAAESRTVLATARQHGGRIEISILTDGPAGTENGLRGALRDAEALISLHGGSLEIDAKATGAILRIRLPELPVVAERPAERAGLGERRGAAAPRQDAASRAPAGIGTGVAVAGSS